MTRQIVTSDRSLLKMHFDKHTERQLICTNGKRDSNSGTKFTVLNFANHLPKPWTESIAIHNCTGISQTHIYSPLCKRKIDSRKGAWEEGTQRAARIQRRDWPRVWQFQPSFEMGRITMCSSALRLLWVEGKRPRWCHHSLRFFLPTLLRSRKERKILGTRNVSEIFKYNLQYLAIN